MSSASRRPDGDIDKKAAPAARSRHSRIRFSDESGPGGIALSRPSRPVVEVVEDDPNVPIPGEQKSAPAMSRPSRMHDEDQLEAPAISRPSRMEFDADDFMDRKMMSPRRDLDEDEDVDIPICQERSRPAMSRLSPSRQQEEDEIDLCEVFQASRPSRLDSDDPAAQPHKKEPSRFDIDALWEEEEAADPLPQHRSSPSRKQPDKSAPSRFDLDDLCDETKMQIPDVSRVSRFDIDRECDKEDEDLIRDDRQLPDVSRVSRFDIDRECDKEDEDHHRQIQLPDISRASRFDLDRECEKDEENYRDYHDTDEGGAAVSDAKAMQIAESRASRKAPVGILSPKSQESPASPISPFTLAFEDQGVPELVFEEDDGALPPPDFGASRPGDPDEGSSFAFIPPERAKPALSPRNSPKKDDDELIPLPEWDDTNGQQTAWTMDI
eukprot:TRINITY_DN13431_c0_g1_i1.p1 TRINITY_DN13431_c0_g1~~TRINITY_DN13431_c0_g1_i1.p1  ORF type:complete len:499 (+),score=88.88 TRINITY_DN13431_c0_g1_i1:184-1497(+)